MKRMNVHRILIREVSLGLQLFTVIGLFLFIRSFIPAICNMEARVNPLRRWTRPPARSCSPACGLAVLSANGLR
jgi:hypothetical protein